jgi:CO/xanthine dehydrogenase Mo-binding subunit
MKDYSAPFFSVGQPVERPDTPDKVRGRALYVADIRKTGMLHVATARSQIAAMRNIRIDTSEAAGLPGVIRIITAADIPGNRFVPLIYPDQPFLAETDIRFFGEPVALVVAETREQAKIAARSVRITGDMIDPVLTPEDALLPDASIIHLGEFGPNIYKTYHIHRGESGAFRDESAVVIERVYRTQRQEHAYLEPQGMIAETDENGAITVMGSMQCPFYVQDAVAAILGLPRALITVIQTVTGGAFGGKEDVPSILAGHAALATKLTGRPVSLIYDREEDFAAMSKRHPSVVRVTIGAGKDGVLTTADINVTLDGGAYATLSPIVLWRSTVHAAGPYNWKAVRINSRAVATNTAPNGAFRGFGEPQVVFAMESAIDELAHLLNLNPLELRLKNVINNDQDVTATGQRIANPGMVETIEKAAAAMGWRETYRAPGRHILGVEDKPLRGMGCAVSFYGVGLGAEGKRLDRAGAYVQVEADASIRIYIGHTELGQGVRGVIAQMASEILTSPLHTIQISRVDTSRVPDSGPTVASRSTIMSGKAIINACLSIRKNLEKAVAEKLQCPLDTIRADARGFYCLSTPDTPISFRDAVDLAGTLRLPLAASGWYVSPETGFNRDTDGQGPAYITYVWSANMVEIEIDPGTLQVTVLKLVSAHDVGKAINPREVCGQIEGGALQGLGFALAENIAYSGVTPSLQSVPDGIMLNPGFHGYICPTAMDAPEIIPVIVEHPFPDGPFGARGIGEPPLIGVAPAVANAVFNATGIRVRDLPLCPENILQEMVRQETGQ